MTHCSEEKVSSFCYAELASDRLNPFDGFVFLAIKQRKAVNSLSNVL